GQLQDKKGTQALAQGNLRNIGSAAVANINQTGANTRNTESVAGRAAVSNNTINAQNARQVESGKQGLDAIAARVAGQEQLQTNANNNRVEAVGNTKNGKQLAANKFAADNPELGKYIQVDQDGVVKIAPPSNGFWSS